LIYARPGRDKNQRTSPSFTEWIENLVWASEHCGGRFHVIIAKAKDVNADPRSIEECFPSKVVMRLTHFDRETGALVAEAEGKQR
jgi:hypothetical protein